MGTIGKKTILIETEENKIFLDAKMLKLKAQFFSKGFQNFPKDLMIEYCSKTTEEEIKKWCTEANNVWLLRSRNDEIFNAFEKAFNCLK